MFALACDPDLLDQDDDPDTIQEPASAAEEEDASARPTEAPRGLAAAPYRAYGPQRDVPAADLIGWTPCFHETFGPSRTSLFTILLSCNRADLMLACRPTGAPAFTLLAHAPREPVTTDTGRSNAPTISNGVGWYFHDAWSWGFAAAGDPIDRDPCDDNTRANADLRLCMQTSEGATSRGFRCGEHFVDSDDWELVVLHTD